MCSSDLPPTALVEVLELVNVVKGEESVMILLGVENVTGLWICAVKLNTLGWAVSRSA